MITIHQKTILKKKEENKEKREKINALYAEAAHVLKTEIPSKRTIEFSYVDPGGGEVEHVYKIKATEDLDAQPCNTKKEELKTVLDNFTTQQHESHIPKLQMVHNKILHVLTNEGTVPVVNPTLEQLVKEEIKMMHREMMEAPEPEYEEVE